MANTPSDWILSLAKALKNWADEQPFKAQDMLERIFEFDPDFACEHERSVFFDLTPHDHIIDILDILESQQKWIEMFHETTKVDYEKLIGSLQNRNLHEQAKNLKSLYSSLVTGIEKSLDKPHKEVMEWNLNLANECREIADQINVELSVFFSCQKEQQVETRENLIKGITLKQAAIKFNNGDEELAKKTKKRWQNKKQPKLPTPLGISCRHSQEYIYKPSSICDFLEKNGEIVASEKTNFLKNFEILQVKGKPK